MENSFEPKVLVAQVSEADKIAFKKKKNTHTRCWWCIVIRFV